MSDRSVRTVYSTGAGRICATCGWPAADCKCSSTFARDEPVPARVTARLRMEKKGRSGKTVTVVDGLPRNAAFLKELTQELKRVCGTGGSAAEDGVELQGDLRDRVRDHLVKKGFSVKG
jgi:translation initiation factor 1